jgi:hypothetical protein
MQGKGVLSLRSVKGKVKFSLRLTNLRHEGVWGVDV